MMQGATHVVWITLLDVAVGSGTGFKIARGFSLLVAFSNTARDMVLCSRVSVLFCVNRGRAMC
jgi:hypothetical protein